MERLFIINLFEPQSRFFYLAWVLTVVVSIVLHELAHGFAAIRLGDRTPILRDRLTLNPFVHMGAFSLVALLLMGMAWGQMPIDPSRLRGRHAEAQVAFAGPAMNLLLAWMALTALALLLRFNLLDDTVNWQANLTTLLTVFGIANTVLFVFNLMPVPPLDGSHVLASFHRGYARFAEDPAHQGAHLLMFMFVFAAAGLLWDPLGDAAMRYVTWLVTVGR